MESMTGYGKSSKETGGLRVTVEMRGVNNKGLDLHPRMPATLWCYEPLCREAVRAAVKRGRVDMFVSLEMLEEESVQVRFSEGVIKALGAVANSMVESGGLARGLTFSDLLSVPEAVVVGLSQTRMDVARECLEGALAGALEKFLECRREEGMRLKGQFQSSAKSLGDLLARARELEGAQSSEIKGRLDRAVAGLDASIDQQRLEQEVALMATRADVREETVRLGAHLQALGGMLDGSKPCEGKRIDHLMQELQREVSTLLAKSCMVELTQVGMEMRLLVEQLREQVQNVA